MKVMLCHRPAAAFGYITDGWANALRSVGIQVQRWNGTQIAWDAFDPDVYIGCSGHKQSIPAKRRAKIAIHVNPYGPADLKEINEPKQSIDWTLAQKPDAVFGYGDSEDAILWSYWRSKHGIQWVPMPTAGDATIYKPADEKQYDIVYLGGRWAYKAKTIDQFLLPMLNKLCPPATYKLHGWGDWPPGIQISRLSEDAAPAFLASGKIGPCIAEPHTHTSGIDVPERMFKVALCATLAICDPVPALKRYMPSCVVAQNPQNYIDFCKHYIEHDGEREILAEQQRREVLDAHTYHHRMHTLLSALGFGAQATPLLTWVKAVQ